MSNDAQVLKEQFGDYIYLIQNEMNYGFAEGNNIGIRHILRKSTPDYILLLNNDTVVHPQFLDELVKVTEHDRSIGIAGPKTYLYSKWRGLIIMGCYFAAFWLSSLLTYWFVAQMFIYICFFSLLTWLFFRHDVRELVTVASKTRNRRW
jgi:cellulose synthase/poly-beta-1,6-N-acetylglucosamine synthase-like glycosyltransferase